MSLYQEIISKRRGGLLGGAARAGLCLLTLPYGAVIWARNWFYDGLAQVHWLDRPCISIGNLTTGGTGKTPVVVWLAGQLIAQGTPGQIKREIMPGAVLNVSHPQRGKLLTALQEIQAGAATAAIFVLALIFVYLFLVAQYESWSIPISVMSCCV